MDFFRRNHSQMRKEADFDGMVFDDTLTEFKK